MAKRKPKNTWILVLGALVLILLVVGTVAVGSNGCAHLRLDSGCGC